ncbi:CMGC kinase, CK2 family [Elysia marginata]|uniref:non-specific serine/threonine protein kinase n=1 Tax=Elysia marginata TaxID=1093978 RepID=A0AAV4HQY2_9GAST|nr:CMGC kinase, CK2 family [Elysia marginata]
MPFYDHGELIQLENENGKPFDTKIITNSILHVAIAVEYLHKHYMAHNDMKLENEFVDNWGYVHLGDVVFVRQMNVETRTVRAKDLGGTPTYWGPEMFQDEPHHRVDPFKADERRDQACPGKRPGRYLDDPHNRVDPFKQCDESTLIRCYTAIKCRDYLAYSMPYYDHGDKIQVENENGKPFDKEIITNSILHVENAVEYLHKHHLAHNDIKRTTCLWTSGTAPT